MTKPKTLDQLRAEKERAETQLAQEQHKLERLENRKKYLEQGVQAATSAEAKKITQPSGAATPRDSDTHKRIAVPKALCVLRERLRPRPKSGKVCRSDTRPGDVRERAARVEGNDSAPPKTPPISACVPLCAIFLGEPSVYKPQFRQKRKRSRSPAGPRRLRNSDTHERIAVPQALRVLREHTRPSPKSGKVCRSDTWPRRVSETCETLRG